MLFRSNDTATTEIYTLSLHDSLPISVAAAIGFLALSQDLAGREIVAIGLVVVASAGALRSAATPAPHD